MLYGQDNELTEAIIGCAIEVHRVLGPGLLESVYENALCIEMTERGIHFQRQKGFPLHYKGPLPSEHRPDLVVSERVVVEVKMRRTPDPDPSCPDADLFEGAEARDRLVAEFQDRGNEKRDQKSKAITPCPPCLRGSCVSEHRLAKALWRGFVYELRGMRRVCFR